jgi:thiol-disulfide isomerase/thioredoxin
MTRRSRVHPGPTCALVFLLLLAAGAAAAQDRAVDWTLETITGETVNFRETLGQGPVVVNFWATWCKPCLKELPHLDRMAGEYEGRVTFLAVNTDNSKAVAKVAPFVRARGLDNLTVPLDTGAEVQQRLQVSILPFLILYDAEGREVYRHIGYKAGDEEELQQRIEALLAGMETGTRADTGKPAWGEAVTATDRLEYSYETDTRKEIFDNWLDVAYQFGGFRTGIMLKSSAPSEEGERANAIEHRFFEYAAGDVRVRAGHFFGIFGRGLIFNAYEDRTVRVDSRLDGLTAAVQKGPLAGTVFSGSPAARDVDVRATDWEYASPWGVQVGATGLTYRPELPANADGTVHRDWAAAVRLRQNFSFGDYYFETGWKEQRNALENRFDYGSALYGNLNLYHGPFSVSWETSDYDKFEIVPRADGIVALNRPPALAREFTWTLLNRAPHVLNANDERGNNLDLMASDLSGWSFVLSGAHLESQAGETVYQLAFGGFEKERFGDFRLKGGFGYQDSEGLRQTAVAELTWFLTGSRSLSLQAEHQHVRLGGGPGFDLGAYDEQWFKLEYETAPRWSFAAILETNNKFEEQRQTDEKAGPFPAGQVTYTISRGGNLNLWAGKRQAGYLCSGGVCKFEPAFAGVELFGVFRY